MKRTWRIVAGFLLVVPLLLAGCGGGGGSDPGPSGPAVIRVSPSAGGLGRIYPHVTAYFNQSLDDAMFDGSEIVLDDGVNEVLGTAYYDSDENAIVFLPSSALTLGTTYNARVNAAAISNMDGLPMAADYSWSFTIAVPQALGSPVVTDPVCPGGTMTVSIPVNEVATYALIFWEIDEAYADVMGQGPGTVVNGTLTIEVPVPEYLSPGDYIVAARLFDDGYASSEPHHHSTMYYDSTGSPDNYTYWDTSGIYDVATDFPLTFFTVAPMPNLVMSIDSITLTGEGTMDVDYTVTNAGQVGAGASVAGFFLNPASEPAPGMTPDATANIAALAAGASASGTVSLSGDAASLYRVWGYADLGEAVAEGGEGDNAAALAVRAEAPVVTVSSTDVPKAIPDYTTVTSVLTVAGGPDALEDITVTINITHTYDADLDIFLVSPSGTRVELTTDNGAYGDNFTDTVFDDMAETSITAGSAPFAGAFRPEGSLASLAGEDSDGTWTLEITDDAGGDIGTLNSWSVSIW